MIWTAELRDAAHAVRDEPIRNNTSLDADVRSRAAEFALHAQVGSTLLPYQAEYLLCLVQRLDTHESRPSHVQFKEAYRAAHQD